MGRLDCASRTAVDPLRWAERRPYMKLGGLPGHTPDRRETSGSLTCCPYRRRGADRVDTLRAAVNPSLGRTHAFDGRTGKYAPGLRGAWTAERNGSTPAREMTSRDYINGECSVVSRILRRVAHEHVATQLRLAGGVFDHSGRFIFLRNALYRGSPWSLSNSGASLMR